MIESRWGTCEGCVTKFVKDWVEPIIEKFRVAIVVGRHTLICLVA